MHHNVFIRRHPSALRSVCVFISSLGCRTQRDKQACAHVVGRSNGRRTYPPVFLNVLRIEASNSLEAVLRKMVAVKKVITRRVGQ
eukprot:3943084-Pleurochrysis_carterae.AAC.1